MVYVKIENGKIVKYPYTEFDLRMENPNVSYPATIGYGFFVEVGAFPVQPTDRPEIDHTQNISEGNPEEIGSGLWRQVWVVTEATKDEIAERTAAKWSAIRSKRNKFLLESDWTQLNNSPLSPEKIAEWASYRQALRDITEQTDPFNAVFPIAPAA